MHVQVIQIRAFINWNVSLRCLFVLQYYVWMVVTASVVEVTIIARYCEFIWNVQVYIYIFSLSLPKLDWLYTVLHQIYMFVECNSCDDLVYQGPV